MPGPNGQAGGAPPPEAPGNDGKARPPGPDGQPGDSGQPGLNGRSGVAHAGPPGNNGSPGGLRQSGTPKTDNGTMTSLNAGQQKITCLAAPQRPPEPVGNAGPAVSREMSGKDGQAGNASPPGRPAKSTRTR
ncbi:hypothetical protein B9Z55_026399 [Caenorhabditis nigoni]|uniref:Uncharacterized protein n=1 Tax=Caenorhabditis nigoni TaxID=1611254 RepID=A0A2G5T2J9_9PELO|nr:hypothetical protein B9Z55_026390 [Caenorhabditis nigoni]PIC21636.1 hypothetical protein B9Z55_026399 [Caenorhabditis nigoni]